MSCVSPINQYTDIIKKLINSNPKYNNFEETAKLLMSSSLSEEQKATAIYYVSNIYKQLAFMDSKKYNLGTGEVLATADNLFEKGFNDYIKLANKKLGIDTSVKKDNSVNEELKKTDTSTKPIKKIEFDKLISKEIDNISRLAFESIEDRKEHIDSREEVFKKIVNNSSNTERVKAKLLESISKAFEKLNTNTDNSLYIDLYEIEELNNVDEFILELKDGKRMYGLKREDGSYSTDTGIVNADDVYYARSIRKKNEFEDLPDGGFSVKTEALTSGFQIEAIDEAHEKEMRSALNKAGVESGAITITAIKLTGINDERMNVIHATEENKQIKGGLGNRTYETFENKSQREILKANPDAKVVSMRRPNSSDGIAFIGEIKGTGERFYLYNLDNYTVVDGRNNTVPFDFENPEHIELLKKFGYSNDNYKLVKLTEDEIESLIKASKLFNAFKKKVSDKMKSAESFDATEMFADAYEFNNKGGKTSRSLKDLVDTDPSLSVEVDTLLIKGSDVSEEKIKLSVNYTRSFDKRTQTFSYKFAPSFEGNRRVVISRNEDGTPKDTVSEIDYVEKILLTNGTDPVSKFLDLLFSKENKKITEDNNSHITNNFLVTFNEANQPVKYTIVDQVTPLYHGEEFMKFALLFNGIKLENTSDSFSKDVKTVLEFDKQNSFAMYNSKSDKKVRILAKFTYEGIRDANDRLVLQMSPGIATGSNDFSPYFRNEKGKVRNEFNTSLKNLKQSINNKLIELHKKGGLIQQVMADYELMDYDGSDSESQNKFFAEVYRLSGLPGTKQSVLNLVKEIDTLADNVKDNLKKEVIGNLKKQFQKIIDKEKETGKEDFLKLLKKHYHHKNDGNSLDDYVFDRFIIDNVNDKEFLDMESKNFKGYKASRKNIIVYSFSNKSVSIEPKSNIHTKSSKPKPALKKVAEKTKPITPKKTVEEEVTNDKIETTEEVKKNPKIKKRKNVIPTKPTNSSMLSVEKDFIEATDAEIEKESVWLSRVLPQFGLKIEDLQEILQLSNIDGTVLGMYKDKVVYLNKSITGVGTIYHEAFHGVFRNLLDSTKRAKLLSDVQGLNKYAKQFTGSALRKFANERGYVYNKQEMSNLVAEEILSDGFKKYMLNESKPKGFMARFFEMLRKLINMMTGKSSEIEDLYTEIKDGGYTKKAIQSEMFEGKEVYESVSGLVIHSKHLSDNVQNISSLSGTNTRIISNKLVSAIFKNTDKTMSFDEKFDQAADQLIQEYDLDAEIERTDNEENREAIEKKYGTMFSQFRFVLGARMNDEKYGYTYDINNTKDEENDYYYADNQVTLETGEIVDNTNGKYSKEALKELAEDKYNKIIAVDYLTDEEMLEDVLTGKQEVFEEEEGDKFNDAMNQKDLGSATGYIRSFLSTIDRDEIDPEFGIRIPKTIDGLTVFPNILRITANQNPKMVIETIKNIAEQYNDDGFIEESKDLMAVYDALVDMTAMDKDGNPQKNKQLYNLFVEVLNVTELNNSAMTLLTPELIEKGKEVTEKQRKQKNAVFFKDPIINSDKMALKEELVQNMINEFNTGNKDKQATHLQSSKDLKVIIKKIIGSNPSNALAVGRMDSEILLNDLTEELHSNLKNLGIILPKSLIKMSIVAIDVKENEQQTPDGDDKISRIYKTHESFIKEDKYLEKDFFRSLEGIINKMYKSDTKLKSFVLMMDEDIKRESSADEKVIKDRFMGIFKKVSEYTLKYNPKILNSVVANAEGKLIYRHSKYNPLTQITEIIRQEGIDGLLKLDPYYAGTLKSFYEDNPWFGSYLKGEESQQSKEMELFFKNINVTLFDGIKQIIGDVAKDGKVFKNIDAGGSMIFQLESFMNRKTLSNEDTSIVTYQKQINQLESGGTNFLIPAIYKSMIAKSESFQKTKSTERNSEAIIKSGAILYKGDYLAIVEDLEMITKQEYNRINREITKKDEQLRLRKEGKSNDLIVKYNANINKGVVTVDDDNLRAYNFSNLEEFWNQNDEKIKEIKDSLIANAKVTGDDHLSFEELDENLINDLRAKLHDYALDSFKKHIQYLVKNKVLEEHIDGNEIWYTSYIPTKIKTDLDSENVIDTYPKLLRNKKDNGMYALAFDHFMNSWRNGLVINQVFDGDLALGTKNAMDLIKRLKKFLAAGPNFKKGTVKTAYVTTIEEYSHNKYTQYGPYKTVEDIENDPLIKDESIRAEIIRDFKNDTNDESLKDKDYEMKGSWQPIFDGQSITSLFHRINMFESMGVLSAKGRQLMISMFYRRLTNKEIKLLEREGVVNNSLKTVTASVSAYQKLSESYINRLDVSYLNIFQEADETKQEFKARLKRKHEQLHGLVAKMFEAKTRMMELSLMDTVDYTEIEKLDTEYKNDVIEYQSNFIAHVGMEQQFDMLNSMEYFNIDQMMDEEASKNATKLPIDIDYSSRTPMGFYNLELSSVNIDSRFKYLQVATNRQHHDSTIGIQKKLLIAADIEQEIKKINANSPNADTKKSITRLEKFLESYRNSLYEGTKSKLDYVKKMMRNELGDIDISQLYEAIRSGLKSQGADDNVINMFQTKNGIPLVNPNMPAVRMMVEYFFFGHYSNNITDDKASGGKGIHESMWGRPVLYDTQENNRIVTSYEKDNNPRKFQDINRYKSRPLGVIEEIEDGVKVYYVEAIIPRPSFIKTKADEIFYLNKLNKIFGVRIPTEDKRSMISMKVVDFSDGSKMNAVIVPQIVHILAGSDFDVDALYMQSLAVYKDAIGNNHIYGEYDDLGSRQHGEFLEYLHFMKGKREFKKDIRKFEKEITDGDVMIDLKQGSAISDLMVNVFGFTMHDTKLLQDYQDIKEKKEKSQQELRDINTSIKGIQDELNDYQKGKIKHHLALLERIKELNTERFDTVAEKEESGEKFNKVQQMYSIIKIYYPILKALSENNMPVTVSQASKKKNKIYIDMVNTKYQNQNLKDSLGIISNKVVFDNLYINERTSDKQFLDVGKEFGLNTDTFKPKGDLYQPDYAVKVKDASSDFKTLVSISAAMNKFLALASIKKLELNKKDTIWNFNHTVNGKIVPVSYNTFYEANEKGERPIQISGGFLGVNADGMKKPVSTMLNMNSINTETVPEIMKAMDDVAESQKAISRELSSDRVYFSSAINNQIMKLVDETNVYDELSRLGVVKNNKKDSKMTFEIEPKNLVIDFKAKPLDIDKMFNQELTVDDIGFSIKLKDSKDSITLNAQKVILLKLYSMQANQANSAKKAGSINNYLKKLNPDINAFDRTDEGITDTVGVESIYTPESIERFSNPNSPEGIFIKLNNDIKKQASKLFLERTKELKSINDLYSPYFNDSRLVGNIITSMMAIHSLRSYLKARTSDDKVRSDFNADDLKNMEEAFSPDSLFTNTIYDEILTMKELHPDNEFLKIFKPETSNIAITMRSDEGVQVLKEHTIRIMSKTKLKGEHGKLIKGDLKELYDSGREGMLFVRKLLYFELARTGMQRKDGSFFDLFPEELTAEVSEGLNYYIDYVSNYNEIIPLTNGGFMVNKKTFTTKKKAENYLAKNEFSVDAEINKLFGGDYDNILSDITEQLSLAIINEKNNNRVKSPDKISIHIDKDNNEKTSALIWAVKNESERNGGKKLSDDQAKEKAIDEINKAISFKERVSTSVILDPKNLTDELYINASEDSAVAKAISKKLNMRSYFDTDDKNIKYVFPVIYKIGKQYYKLDKVDGKKIQPKIESSVEEKPMNHGREGVYVKIDESLLESLNSPVGKTAEERSSYLELLSNKPKVEEEKLNYVKKGNIAYSKEFDILRKLHDRGEAVYTMRVSKKQTENGYGFKKLDENKHFGNPFTHSKEIAKKSGLVHVETIEKAVEYYDAWLKGQNEFVNSDAETVHLDELKDRREWIRGAIKAMKANVKSTGKKITLGYFKQGYISHADVLDHYVNGATKFIGVDKTELNTDTSLSKQTKSKTKVVAKKTKTEGQGSFDFGISVNYASKIKTINDKLQPLYEDLRSVMTAYEMENNNSYNYEISKEKSIREKIGRLNKESIKKETGFKSFKDINNKFISAKGGVTIPQMAHNIWMDHADELQMEIDEIEQVIVETIQQTDKQFKESFFDANKLDALDKERKIIESKMNRLTAQRSSLINSEKKINLAEGNFEQMLANDVGNMELSKESLEYLYKVSGSKMKFNDFAINRKNTASNLYGKLNTEEIIEALKCK